MAQKKLNQKKISPFVIKLISLLEDPDSKGFIQWVSSQTFVIVEPNSFSKNILPKYYKHQNLSSFIRQLNIYGFSKIKSTDQGQFYSNPNFVKNSRKKLRMIQRRSHIRPETSKSMSNQWQFSSNSSFNAKNNRNFQMLKAQNEKYKKKKQLIQLQINKINQETRRQVENIINFFCTLINNMFNRDENIGGINKKLQQQYRTVVYILQEIQVLIDDKILNNDQRVLKMVNYLNEKRSQLEQKIEKDRQPKAYQSVKQISCVQNQQNCYQLNNLQLNDNCYCRVDDFHEQINMNNRQDLDDIQSNNFFANIF